MESSSTLSRRDLCMVCARVAVYCACGVMSAPKLISASNHITGFCVVNCHIDSYRFTGSFDLSSSSLVSLPLLRSPTYKSFYSMSAYQQLPGYHYPPPISHAPYPVAYQPPNPFAYLHNDANAFRQFYAAHLVALTVNSRPVIQNLSMIAQDFQRMSAVVAQCLEAHLRRVSDPLYCDR